MTQNSNPLQAWFRQPAIYIRLPSSGEFWASGALEMPENHELPVLPMTAMDEITYRTPDALYNGQAVVDVIQSCIPSIKNAWKTPSVDINSLLISIRIASYGHEMEITSSCPKCSETSDYLIDLRKMLDLMGRPDYTTTVRSGDLEIFFRPMTFEEQNKISIQQFETQKTIQAITDSTESDDVKIAQMTNVMKRITESTTQALTNNIAGIRSPAGFVNDWGHIVEFLSNCDRGMYNTIRDHGVKLRADSDPRPVTVTCNSCQHVYEQSVNLDMSSFFGGAS